MGFNLVAQGLSEKIKVSCIVHGILPLAFGNRCEVINGVGSDVHERRCRPEPNLRTVA
jgi:hypothetical protein